MTSTVRDNPSRTRYEILVQGDVAGFSDYQLGGDRITVTHTEVDDAHAGQGLGEQLVTGLLADADRRGLAVVPLCSYVRKVITRNTAEYLHLVPEDVRERLGVASPGD